MKRYRYLWVMMLSVFIISGWSQASSSDRHRVDPVIAKAREVSSAIHKQDWTEALNLSKQMNIVFRKEKWKLQLLGDEEEYEELNREIDKLSAAVQAKESTDALIILATINSIIEEIYSM